MSGTTAWTVKNWWRRFTAMRSSKYSGVTSSIVWRSSWAALLTRMVIGPSAFRTASIAVLTAAMSVRSHGSKWTVWRFLFRRETSAFEFRLLHVEEADLRPLRGEVLDDRFADAAAAAGDENGAALEARIDGAVFHSPPHCRHCFPPAAAAFALAFDFPRVIQSELAYSIS